MAGIFDQFWCLDREINFASFPEIVCGRLKFKFCGVFYFYVETIDFVF